jgi:hypothetical protein
MDYAARLIRALGAEEQLMSIDQIECEGTDALLRLEQLRDHFSSTKNYPFIIGDREELERLLENMKYDDRLQSAIVTESLGIDVLAWFEQRKSEAHEDGFVDEDMVGEWSGESQEKESIKSYLDILTGAIKPVVYIGIANIDQPWMLPAETKYGGGMSARMPPSSVPLCATGKRDMGPRL